LVLNRAVWDAHLGRLRALVAAKEQGTEVWIMRPYDGTGAGGYVGEDLGPGMGPSLGQDMGPDHGPDRRPNGPQPVAGAVQRARELVQEWAGDGRSSELLVDELQRIVGCDPIVAGRRTDSWTGTDAWSTFRDELGTDPSSWRPVDLGDDDAVLCLEGTIDPPGGPQRSVRAYVADDEIGQDGQLGYRVFLASQETRT
jgi:hypothetical protein